MNSFSPKRLVVRSLHTIQSLDNKLGGAVHAGLNVCKYLFQEGQPVEVFSTKGPTDDLEYLNKTYAEVTSHTVPRCFPARWYNGSGMDRWLNQNLNRFDLVELHAVFSFVTVRGAMACRRARKPYLLRPHGSLDPFDLSKRRVFKQLLGPIFLRPVLSGCSGVVCTSQREADVLETYGANPKRYVVPLPVPSIESNAESGREFRIKHGIPLEAFVVLFISRIDYKKGLEFLLPALQSARRNHSDLWFVLAGSGSPEFVRGIRNAISALGLSNVTREVGFISGSEKAAAFQAADLFALPSLNENFGIVVVEAMQAGRPVLISDQVYIYPDIINGSAGVLCQPNSSDCTRALNEILKDRNRCKKMGQQAALVATSKFSPQSATSELLEVYSKVLKRAQD